MARISKETRLLNEYKELVKQEAKDLSILENLISETSLRVNQRKRNINTAIEQTRRQEESSAKQHALKELYKKLEEYEKQTHIVNQYHEELMSIRRDYSFLITESTSFSDIGTVLSNKVQLLIDKITETL